MSKSYDDELPASTIGGAQDKFLANRIDGRYVPVEAPGRWISQHSLRQTSTRQKWRHSRMCLDRRRSLSKSSMDLRPVMRHCVIRSPDYAMDDHRFSIQFLRNLEQLPTKIDSAS